MMLMMKRMMLRIVMKSRVRICMLMMRRMMQPLPQVSVWNSRASLEHPWASSFGHRPSEHPRASSFGHRPLEHPMAYSYEAHRNSEVVVVINVKVGVVMLHSRVRSCYRQSRKCLPLYLAVVFSVSFVVIVVVVPALMQVWLSVCCFGICLVPFVKGFPNRLLWFSVWV